MNERQRLAIFFAGLLLTSLVILHSPWTGYDTYEWKAVQLSADELRQWQERSGGRMIGAPQELARKPFVQWRSVQPLASPFAGLVTTSVTAMAIVALTGLWCFLYREKSKPSGQPPTSQESHGT